MSTDHLSAACTSIGEGNSGASDDSVPEGRGRTDERRKCELMEHEV